MRIWIWFPCTFNKIDVSFSCVCPVNDHEFRHNIVKVPVRGYRIDYNSCVCPLIDDETVANESARICAVIVKNEFYNFMIINGMD